MELSYALSVFLDVWSCALLWGWGPYFHVPWVSPLTTKTVTILFLCAFLHSFLY